MRTRIVDGSMVVDLITSNSQVVDVLRIALAAGLESFRIERIGDDHSMVVQINPPEGDYASTGYAAMLAVAAEIEQRPAEQYLEHFRADTRFDEHKRDGAGQPA